MLEMAYPVQGGDTVFFIHTGTRPAFDAPTMSASTLSPT